MSSSPDRLYGPKSSLLITGASSGIGASLAVRLARHGGHIALLARRRERLDEVAARVRAEGGEPLVVLADVVDRDSVARAYREVVSAQGPVDVAFLNAGVGDATRLAKFDARRVREVFEVNVFGVANWLEALLPDLIARGRGVIAVTSSLVASIGLPGSSVYAASKAAVSTMLESLRIEATRAGLQLTIVEPGFVKSEMTEKNRFKMPFLMEADEAARIIADEVADGSPLVRFPWPMKLAVKLMSELPPALFDRVGANWVKRKA
jgi:short-subunit dehydrogenase